MTFLTLFNRIGKQPVKYTSKNTVKALLKHSELEELLKSGQEEYIVPLELMFANSGKELYLKPTQNKA